MKTVPFKDRQKAMSRNQTIDELKIRSDDVFDPETAPKLSHNWTHRGIRHVCEGAGHPRHEAFTYRPKAR